MAKASKDAERLILLWDLSMKRSVTGVAGSTGLAQRWPFFTRSTARGVLDSSHLPPTRDSSDDTEKVKTEEMAPEKSWCQNGQNIVTGGGKS